MSAVPGALAPLGIVMAVVVGGCTTAAVTPSASVTTLTPDAERWFRLSWEPVPDKNGGVRVRGYLENTYGEAADRVQLLAQALDGDGHVIAQRIDWVPETVPGLGRVYYEIPGLPPAPQYRVTVWSYERLEGGPRIIR
jgi:hypothetical protein